MVGGQKDSSSWAACAPAQELAASMSGSAQTVPLKWAMVRPVTKLSVDLTSVFALTASPLEWVLRSRACGPSRPRNKRPPGSGGPRPGGCQRRQAIPGPTDISGLPGGQVRIAVPPADWALAMGVRNCPAMLVRVQAGLARARPLSPPRSRRIALRQ